MEARPIRLDEAGNLLVPDHVVIPFITGDGIGKDIWPAARTVMDAAVRSVFGDSKSIQWLEVEAGNECFNATGDGLPDASIQTISDHHVAIKGPMSTPVGKGMRSLNVRLRQTLDLFACIRPVAYYPPVPSPVKYPEKTDIVVFRENTEDLYAGIEWDSGEADTRKLIQILNDQFGTSLSHTASLGLKPMTPEGSKRLIASAIAYALENGRKSVTLMHKGNIMKFTEGGFREWGYEVAKEQFPDQVITEQQLWDEFKGEVPAGKVLLKDRIADMIFAEVLIRPEDFEVIASPNLNGDYISDALAAQVGGLGIAPGANVGSECAVFEATHGTAPDIAGQDKANPCSLILSGAMMMDHLGWQEVGDKIRSGVAKALAAGKVTPDLAGQIQGGEAVSCSQFAEILKEAVA